MAMPTDETSERLDAFDRALDELRGMVDAMPTSEQADRAIRTEDKVGRLLSLVLLPTFLLLGLIVFVAVGTFQTRDSARANYEGVQCLLSEMAAHRVNNNHVNEAIARAVGVPETSLPPTLLPEADLQELHERCEQFFPRQSLGQR